MRATTLATTLLNMLLCSNLFAQSRVFSASYDVLYAVDDGPIVISCNLKYHGDEEFRFVYSTGYPSFSIAERPYYWKETPESIIGGSKRTLAILKKGDVVRQYLLLHDRFVGIGAGNIEFTVKWPLTIKSPKYELLEYKSVIQFYLEPYSTIEAKSWKNMIVKEIESGRLNPDNALIALQWTDQKTPELLPALYYLLSLSALDVRKRTQVLYNIESCEGFLHHHTHGILQHLASTCNPSGSPLLCKWLHDHRLRLSVEDWKLLRSIKHPLTRGMLWLHFGEQWAKGSVADGLLLELTNAYQHAIEPTKIKILLTLLDADQYRVREGAATALLGMGMPVLSHLKEAKAQTKSPQVAVRLEQLIQAITQAKPSSAEVDYLNYLSEWRGPESRLILQALTHNIPESYLSKRAKVILERPR